MGAAVFGLSAIVALVTGSALMGQSYDSLLRAPGGGVLVAGASISAAVWIGLVMLAVPLTLLALLLRLASQPAGRPHQKKDEDRS